MGGQLTRVTRDALARPVLTVARDLLGAVVAHADRDGVVAVRLTEVEAYAGPADPASHAARGRTPRTAVMFGPAGHAYVYFSYGMHWCLNVVAGPDGEASAVLLRAGEVVEGLSLAVDRRPGATRRDLARGPARLTRTLGVDREQDGADLCTVDAALRLECGGPIAGDRMRSGPRVGVSVGTDSPWRFWLAGEPTVSAWRPGRPRRRPG